MELAAALHHSWDAGPTELRYAPTDADDGKRDAASTTACGCCSAAATSGTVPGPWWCSLAGVAPAGDAMDGATLSFLVQAAVLAQAELDKRKREEEKKREEEAMKEDEEQRMVLLNGRIQAGLPLSPGDAGSSLLRRWRCSVSGRMGDILLKWKTFIEMNTPVFPSYFRCYLFLVGLVTTR